MRTLGIEVTRYGTDETREVRLPVPESGPGQWSIGGLGSRADLEIDEPGLDRVELWLFAGGVHLLLKGRVHDVKGLPPLYVGLSDHGGTWTWKDPVVAGNTLRGHDLQIRFDDVPLRLGSHILTGGTLR